MRLKDMAHVRASTIATTIRQNNRQPGQPRLPRAATVIEASANGSAKTVCEIFTNSPHLAISRQALDNTLSTAVGNPNP